MVVSSTLTSPLAKEIPGIISPFVGICLSIAASTEAGIFAEDREDGTVTELSVSKAQTGCQRVNSPDQEHTSVCAIGSPRTRKGHIVV